MIAMLTIAAIFAVLFILAFATRRRFGILGLGLVAGTIISGLFGDHLNFFIYAYAHWLYTPSLIDVPSLTSATVILTLAPALLLMIAGPKYTKGQNRSVLLSSLAFGVVALLLIIAQQSASFGINDAIYSFEGAVHGFFPFLIVGVVIVSVVDIIMGHGPGFKPMSKH